MPDPKRVLPPGQYITREFPVCHVGALPHFDAATWDLRIGGLVENPLRFDHRSFLDLPREQRVSDFHCVSTWTRPGLAFGGIRLHRLLTMARPMPEGRFVAIHADGGYSTNLTMEDALDDTVIIADRLDGEPLSPEHGHPARLVVPKKYGYKSAKWIRSIEIVPHDRPGFWESRGYSTDGDVMTERRFERPDSED